MSAHRVALAVLAALTLSGCPSPAPERPAPPPRRTAPTPRPAPADLPGPTHRAHAELLALTPEWALAEGLASARLAGEGLLALVEQLQAEGTPVEALELCLVAFDRARDDLAPGAELPEDRHAELERSLRVQAEGLPALARWTAALRGHLVWRRDADAVVQLLARAREVWLVGDALKRCPRRTR